MSDLSGVPLVGEWHGAKRVRGGEFDSYAIWTVDSERYYLLQAHQHNNRQPGATWRIYTVKWGRLQDRLIAYHPVKPLIPLIERATSFDCAPQCWPSIHSFMRWARGYLTPEELDALPLDVWPNGYPSPQEYDQWLSEKREAK